MNEIKVVLFDLGRVLMHIDFEAFPKGLGMSSLEMQQRFDTKTIQKNVRAYETGMLTTDQFLHSLVELFHRQFSREQILTAFNDIIIEDNQEIIPFVEEVRSRYHIVVLSNTCACHWEKVERVSSLIKIFPDLFTSFQLGAMKPDATVYSAVCSTLKVKPSDVVFIDDLGENVEGARNCGMKGIVFFNTSQLQSDFSIQQW